MDIGLIFLGIGLVLAAVALIAGIVCGGGDPVVFIVLPIAVFIIVEVVLWVGGYGIILIYKGFTAGG